MSSGVDTLCSGLMCSNYQKVEKPPVSRCFSVYSSNRTAILPALTSHVQRNRLLSGIKCRFLKGQSRADFPIAARFSRVLLSPRRACRARSEDSEGGGSVSHEDVVLDQQMLEQELRVAIAEENYAKAAKIRDSIRILHEDSEASLRAANVQFYKAFKDGDINMMQMMWARGDNVCCVHPGSIGISGYDSVIDSWNHVWANYKFPLEIELQEVRVHVRGDSGYVTCVELVKTKGSSWGGQFVTNVFEKVDGRWLICVHHASPFDF